MKKITAIILSGIMLSSTALCGCSKSKNEKDASKTESQKEESVTESKESENAGKTGSQTEVSESEAAKSAPVLNEENIKKVSDYAASIDSERDGEAVYFEGIRGDGFIFVDDKGMYFVYDTPDSDRVEFRIDWKTSEADFTFDLDYEDTRYYVKDDLYLDRLEEVMDKLIEDPRSIQLNDDSALAEHGEEIKKDLSIMYARMITLADNAFPELGLGLKDMVTGFGDKYRAVDPTQLTSKEVEVTNEHKFVDGFCSDCGMAWTEYYYDVVGQFMHVDFGNGQHTVTGQNSTAMMERSDQVQYSADDKESADMYFHHKEIDNDRHINNSEMCRVFIDTYGQKIETSVEYSYEQGAHASVTSEYFIKFSAHPGEYDKVFESKEAFKKYAEITLNISKEDGTYISEAFGTMSESEIRKILEDAGQTYYSEDEIVDRFWEHRESFFASLDNGMVWMKTTLADIGLNWK